MLKHQTTQHFPSLSFLELYLVMFLSFPISLPFLLPTSTPVQISFSSTWTWATAMDREMTFTSLSIKNIPQKIVCVCLTVVSSHSYACIIVYMYIYIYKYVCVCTYMLDLNRLLWAPHRCRKEVEKPYHDPPWPTRQRLSSVVQVIQVAVRSLSSLQTACCCNKELVTLKSWEIVGGIQQWRTTQES